MRTREPPPKVAHNFPGSVFNMTHNRWNCNAAISICERLTGKLRATLLGNRAMGLWPGWTSSTHLGSLPPKVACNSVARIFWGVYKRWNCNDRISICERLIGKLHATLLGNHAMGSHPGPSARQASPGLSSETACSIRACARRRRLNIRQIHVWGRALRPTPTASAKRRDAHASLGATVTTVWPMVTGPGAAGVIAPNFFLFVTTIGVMVS